MQKETTPKDIEMSQPEPEKTTEAPHTSKLQTA
jgi:hypothetical protein